MKSSMYNDCKFLYMFGSLEVVGEAIIKSDQANLLNHLCQSPVVYMKESCAIQLRRHVATDDATYEGLSCDLLCDI